MWLTTHEERIKKPQISTVKTSIILLAKRLGDTKRHFSEEDIRTANEPQKRWWRSLATWALQIKTIKTGNYTPIRTTGIKNSDNTQCWWGRGGQNLTCCRWEREPLWKIIRLLKLNAVKHSYLWPSNSIPRYVCKRNENKGTQKLAH